MQGHIHLSIVSVSVIVAVVLLTNFTVNRLAEKLATSDSESAQQWGAALNAVS
jgi:hypothetical protein